jgi:hypothetical protein
VGPLAGAAGAGVVAGAVGAASFGAAHEGSVFAQPQDGSDDAAQELQVELESLLEQELQLEDDSQLDEQQWRWNKLPKWKPPPPQPPQALACDATPAAARQSAATTTIIRFIKIHFMEASSKPVSNRVNLLPSMTAMLVTVKHCTLCRINLQRA